MRSTSLTGSSGSLSESEGRPKPEDRRGWLGDREWWYALTKGARRGYGAHRRTGDGDGDLGRP